MGVHERRRLVFATVLTVVALPAIWLIDRDDPDGSQPAVAAIGVPSQAGDAPGDGGAGAADPSSTEESFVPQVPVFLGGTVQVAQPAVIDIAVPGTASGTQASVSLTYLDYQAFAASIGAPDDQLCTLPSAPTGARVTVTNLDNGQQVSCTNTLGMSVPIGADMAIDINLFVRIADLVDAPVPVVANW